MDASASPESVAALWPASQDEEDSWRVFYERAYSA
jgi:hypothetical protein